MEIKTQIRLIREQIMTFPRKWAVCLLGMALLATPPPFAATPKSALLDSFALETAAPRERITVKLEHAGTAFIQSWEIVRPDRYHFVQTGAGQRQEFFLLGNSLYTASTAGWSKMDVPAVPKPPIADPVQKAIIESLDQVILQGTETLRGQATDHYRVRVRLQDIRGSISGVMDVWVTRASGLPLQINFVGQLGEESYRLEKSLEYDPSVQVVAPH